MKFLVVDVDSVFRRRWEALGDGAVGDAARSAFSQIMGARDDCDRIVLCGDKGRSFRVTADPEYKSGRVDPGEAYREQRRALVTELIRATGATAWASPAVAADDDGRDLYGEADDVIASFCLWYEERRTAGGPGFDGVRILSGDTDLWALVDDSLGIAVRTLEGIDIGTDQVVERFGVSPYLVPELKALMGDTSDRYAPFRHPERNGKGGSMPGIGPKTAAQIVLGPRSDDERSGADAALRRALEGEEPLPGAKLPANVTTCLRHGGVQALTRGRMCAHLRPCLRLVDGTWHPLDFSSVLAEPRPGAQREPPPTDAVPPTPSPPAAAPAPPTQPATPVAMALAIPAGSQREQSLARSGLDPYALEPTGLSSAMELAHEVFVSRLYPNMPNEAAVLTLMCRARCLGIPAALAGDYFDYVQGRLAWRAQGLLAVVKAHHTCRKLEFDWPRCNDLQAVLLFQRAGERAGEYMFTTELARRAGFLDGKHSAQWSKRPAVMLRWAAVRELCRAVWPDIVGGLYTRGEIEGGAEDADDGVDG